MKCNKGVSFHPAYSAYTQKLFKEEPGMKGVTIDGINLNKLRYADGTALLCFCPTDLQELLNAANKAGKPSGMEMNIIKSKTMVISKTTPTPKINITLEEKPVQQPDKMIYLGSLKSEDGKCEKEIRRRIELARSAFEKMSNGTKIKTLTKVIQNKLEAFEMWIYSRMMGKPLTEHKSNEEVLKMTISKRSLIATIKERKLQYF